MAKPLRLIGAATALISVWLPWYGVHFAVLSRQLDTGASNLPPEFSAFARGLFSAVPDDVHVNGWTAMDGGDIAIAFLAAGLGLLAFVAADRWLPAAAAIAIAGIAAVHIASPAGPDGLLTPKAGPWVALVGAALALASALMSDGAPEPVALDPLPVWAEAPAAPTSSVAPPG